MSYLQSATIPECCTVFGTDCGMNVPLFTPYSSIKLGDWDTSVYCVLYMVCCLLFIFPVFTSSGQSA